MKDEHNKTDEPDFDSWQPLSTANTRLLRKIFPMALSDAAPKKTTPLTTDAKEKKQSRGDTDAGRKREQKNKEHQRYVDQRLQSLRAFERKAAGTIKR